MYRKMKKKAGCKTYSLPAAHFVQFVSLDKKQESCENDCGDFDANGLFW